MITLLCNSINITSTRKRVNDILTTFRTTCDSSVLELIWHQLKQSLVCLMKQHFQCGLGTSVTTAWRPKGTYGFWEQHMLVLRWLDDFMSFLVIFLLILAGHENTVLMLHIDISPLFWIKFYLVFKEFVNQWILL